MPVPSESGTRRQMKSGLLSAPTYDFELRNDGCVTVRDRDSMQQFRIPISELKNYIGEKIALITNKKSRSCSEQLRSRTLIEDATEGIRVYAVTVSAPMFFPSIFFLMLFSNYYGQFGVTPLLDKIPLLFSLGWSLLLTAVAFLLPGLWKKVYLLFSIVFFPCSC
jgi:hypothetical protein